jgi:hypothetical protein
MTLNKVSYSFLQLKDTFGSFCGNKEVGTVFTTLKTLKTKIVGKNKFATKNVSHTTQNGYQNHNREKH